MSELDRLSSAATRLIGSIARYTEEAAAKFSGKERHEVEATLRQAKAIGELTVLMSTSKVKALLASAAPVTPTDPPSTPASRVDEQPVMDAPLPDYDSLTASQIVALMADLDSEERAVIVAYETQHRRRSTILNAGHL